MFQMYTIYILSHRIDNARCSLLLNKSHWYDIVFSSPLKSSPGFRRFSLFRYIMAKMVLRVGSLSISFHCVAANKNQLLNFIQRIEWSIAKKGTDHTNTYQIHYQCDKYVCVWMSARVITSFHFKHSDVCYIDWTPRCRLRKQNDKIIDKLLKSTRTYPLVHLSLIYTITLEESQKATFGENGESEQIHAYTAVYCIVNAFPVYNLVNLFVSRKKWKINEEEEKTSTTHR